MSLLRVDKLPEDILSKILYQLQPVDVARLRQTCKEIESKISKDKQYWIHVIKEYVHDRGGRLPVQIEAQSLGDVEASTVEYWARTALALDKTYTRYGSNSISFISDLSCVTWTKIVRGRWCLVASSNLSQSRLILFDGLNGLSSEDKTEYFLEGPVMDGVMEDSSLSINLALSIGTKRPFIQVLTIGICESKVAFTTRAIIHSSYCTRLIKGRLIGFAVRNGDDAVPHIADWISGNVWPLQCPDDISTDERGNERKEQGVCRAMTTWKKYLLVTYMDHIEVFLLPSSLPAELPKYYALLELKLELPARSVDFFTYCLSPTLCWSRGHSDQCTTLYMIARNVHDELHFIEVSFVAEEVKDSFRIKEFSDTFASLTEGLERPYVTNIGSTGSMICYISLDRGNHTKLPNIHLVRIQPPHLWAGSPPGASVFNRPISIPSSGFPLLHMFPCMDYDDGRGVALVGNAIGEICLVEFEGGGVSNREGIDDELPAIDVFNYQKGCSFLPEHPVPLDLPPLYNWLARKTLSGPPWSDEYLDDVPKEIVDTSIFEWRGNFDYQLSLPNWSNDWSNFDYPKQWLTPILLWGDADPTCCNYPTISAELRTHYRIIGEPRPLLFNIKYPCVIFRIGSRLFILSYEMHGGALVDRISRLHLSAEQLLSGHITDQTIFHADSELENFTSVFIESQERRLETYHDTREFALKVGLSYEGERTNSWSQEKWDYLYELRQDYLGHFRSGEDDERFDRWLREKGLAGYGKSFEGDHTGRDRSLA